MHIKLLNRVKGKVHPKTSHEGPEGVDVQLYSYLKLGASWGWMVNDTPPPL